MPEIGPMELLVCAVIALIVFGPEKLPDMARKAGNLLGDLRRLASDARTELDDFRNIDVDDDDDDSFDPQDEKSTPASEADEADRAEAKRPEDEKIERPIVHKETRNPSADDE